MTLLADLVATSRNVGATAARLAKVRALAAQLAAFEPNEIEIGAHYLAGATPQGRFGIGYAVLSAATDGPAADKPTLSLIDVDRRLDDIAAMRGTGAASARAAALRELFSLATADEREFLIQLLAGELRQGALAGVMADAIAAAAKLPPAPVRRALMYATNIGAVAQAALRDGEQGLASFQLEVLSPIAPMLAQTAVDPAEALQKLGGEAAFEWKMDGARIQVHKSERTVRVYTRNLNDVTAAVPEIVEAVAELPARDLILDGE
ncbi:MAG: hypothetical protein ACREPX_05265, partial [Rhodanobacteraceae bacterium]